MTAEPACLGAGDLFLDPHRMTDAVGVCQGCGCRETCLLEAIESIWVNEDGEPEAWLVRGGLYPHQQAEVWRQSLGGRLKGVIHAAVS